MHVVQKLMFRHADTSTLDHWFFLGPQKLFMKICKFDNIPVCFRFTLPRNGDRLSIAHNEVICCRLSPLIGRQSKRTVADTCSYTCTERTLTPLPLSR